MIRESRYCGVGGPPMQSCAAQPQAAMRLRGSTSNLSPCLPSVIIKSRIMKLLLRRVLTSYTLGLTCFETRLNETRARPLAQLAHSPPPKKKLKM